MSDLAVLQNVSAQAGPTEPWVADSSAEPMVADMIIFGGTIAPARASALVAVDSAMAALLVERGYGGVSGQAMTRRKVTGHAERHQAALIADLVLAACSDAAATAMQAVAITRGADQPDADILAALDRAAPHHIVTLLVTTGVAEARYRVLIIMPDAVLRHAAAVAVVAAPRGDAAARWARTLSIRAGDIAMPTRSVIARPMLSVAQLMALRPGDVIPITCPRSVPLLVADRHIASGTIGERDGRVAFMIDHFEPEHVR